MTEKDNGCVGSYSVSGYTRGDGISVSSYTRTCGAAHNSSINKTTSTSKQYLTDEEKMQRRADILYPTMMDKTKNKEENDKIFKDSMKIVFNHEGGYSDDPDDFGGKTNMGITQSTYDNYCKRKGIKTKEVKNLTKEEATNVYYNDYWKASRADKIDNPVGALIMFDTAILHGVGRAKQFYKEANGDFEKMIQLRKNHYEKRVKEVPSQKKYLNGWNNRANHLYQLLKEYENKN